MKYFIRLFIYSLLNSKTIRFKTILKKKYTYIKIPEKTRFRSSVPLRDEVLYTKTDFGKIIFLKKLPNSEMRLNVFRVIIILYVFFNVVSFDSVKPARVSVTSTHITSLMICEYSN